MSKDLAKIKDLRKLGIRDLKRLRKLYKGNRRFDVFRNTAEQIDKLIKLKQNDNFEGIQKGMRAMRFEQELKKQYAGPMGNSGKEQYLSNNETES